MRDLQSGVLRVASHINSLRSPESLQNVTSNWRKPLLTFWLRTLEGLSWPSSIWPGVSSEPRQKRYVDCSKSVSHCCCPMPLINAITTGPFFAMRM